MTWGYIGRKTRGILTLNTSKRTLKALAKLATGKGSLADLADSVSVTAKIGPVSTNTRTRRLRASFHGLWAATRRLW